jgi:ribosome-associated translation inhibitor RaiA
MNIDIQTRGFRLTSALERCIRKHLEGAVDGRQPQIKRMQVRLSDINGPRGGADKRCRVYIGLPRLRDVIVETTDSDMYRAIARAADRAGGAVERRLTKRRARMYRAGGRESTGERVGTAPT